MTSARQIWLGRDGAKKLPYIRSEDGRLAYVLQNAFTGPGQYELGWLGAVNVSGGYSSGAWCGPFGLYVPAYSMAFRWYISKPANELSTKRETQFAFIDAMYDVPFSSLSSVYSDGAVTKGWLVRQDDLTYGSGKQSKLYCDGVLVASTSSNVRSGINDISSLPIGIMSGIDLSGPTATVPSSFSPLTSGLRFYRLYVKKDGVLIHDCYPVLDGTEPKIYDSVTRMVIAKSRGTASFGFD